MELATGSLGSAATVVAASAGVDTVSDAARAADDAVGAVGDAAAIAAAVASLAGKTGSSAAWPLERRRDVLASMDRAIDGLGALRAALLVAERASGAWEGLGDRSFEAWRGRTSRAGQRTATAQVRQAEQLDTVPAVAEAVTEGRIGLDHATIIAKVAATGTPAQREAATSPEGQEALLGLAERVDAGTFQTAANRWAAELDPAKLEHDHQAQRAARFLNLTETANGTYIKGLLDSYSGHKLALAIEAATPKPPADDERTPEQRRADSMTTIAETILSSADTKPGAHVPPQVSLILTEETWLAAQAERERTREAREMRGEATDTEPPTVATTVVGYPPATLQDGTPVPTTELAVALCECELTRIVIDAEGVPLNAGRTERLFTGVQRFAVIARDRECGWPDCHAHARWCHVHHLDWWERDLGETSVANGLLLCSFHHHEVHRRDLTITRHTLAEPEPERLSGRAIPRGTMARVRYEFRDPDGKVIGRESPAAVGGPRPKTRLSSSASTGAGAGANANARRANESRASQPALEFA